MPDKETALLKTMSVQEKADWFLTKARFPKGGKIPLMVSPSFYNDCQLKGITDFIEMKAVPLLPRKDIC